MRKKGWATRPGRVRPGARRAAALVAALMILVAPAPGRAAAAAPGATQKAEALPPAPPAQIDARSAPLVDSLMAAMGGLEAWNAIPAIRFDFVILEKDKPEVRRSHWWDKAHGRCRVEWTDDRGRKIAAVVRLSDGTGRSCTAGVADADPLRAKHVERAYAMWVNDTYWFSMPFKLHDPGVRIAYDRPEKRAEGAYDVLSLTFADVGLTPKDHYWLFLNRRTHRIDRWEYLLQGREPPPQAASWTDWRQVGPVTMPLLHCVERRPVDIRFQHVSAPGSFDEKLLTDPCAGA
jgi:hypothetical protein